MIHGALSANSTCDQLHFSMMQEFAHQGWNTMLERAMQCVDPSVALVWWNEAADRRNFGDDDADDVSASLLNSPIWSNEYMGGRANYEASATNPHAYVQNGKFANFPLRRGALPRAQDSLPRLHRGGQLRLARPEGIHRILVYGAAPAGHPRRK